MTTYTGQYTWRLGPAGLRKFKKCKIKHYVISGEFESGGSIKWRVLCYPKGDSDHGDCGFYFQIASFPSKYKKIVILQQIVCQQKAGVCRAICTYDQTNDTFGWIDDVCTGDELMNLISSKKSLQFQCSVKILQIEGNDGKLLFQNPLNIDFNEMHEFTFDWKIKNQLLATFKQIKNSQVIYDEYIHQNMWSFRCIPNGHSHDDYGCVRMGLQLCALPTNIESITSTFKLECVSKQIVSSGQYVWKYDDEGLHVVWDKNMLLLKDLAEFDEIHFKGTINVQSYTTYDGLTYNIDDCKNDNNPNSIGDDDISIMNDTMNNNKHKKRLLPTNMSEIPSKMRKIDESNDNKTQNFEQLYNMEKEQHKVSIKKIEMLEKELRKLRNESEQYRFVASALKDIAQNLPSARLNDIDWAKDNVRGNFILRSRSLNDKKQRIQKKYMTLNKKDAYIIENISQLDKKDQCDKQEIKQIKKFVQKNGIWNTNNKIEYKTNMCKLNSDVLGIRVVGECSFLPILKGQLECYAKVDIDKGVILGQYIGNEYLEKDYHDIYNRTKEQMNHLTYMMSEELKYNNEILDIYIDAFAVYETNMNDNKIDNSYLLRINDGRVNIKRGEQTEDDTERMNCCFLSVLCNGWPLILVQTIKKITKLSPLWMHYGVQYGLVLDEQSLMYDAKAKRVRSVEQILTGIDLKENEPFLLT
eukprot:216201_1